MPLLVLQSLPVSEYEGSENVPVSPQPYQALKYLTYSGKERQKK